jgi:hypothetical protein
MRWILERVESAPACVFPEWELEKWCPTGFRALREQKVLERLEHPSPGALIWHRSRRHLLLVENPDGTIEGIDPDDFSFEPVALDSSELTRWQFSAEKAAAAIRTENGLQGRQASLGARLHLIGIAVRSGQDLAVVLGLFTNEQEALESLRGLATLMTVPVAGFVVVLPTLLLSFEVLRELQRLDIVCTGFSSQDTFRIEPASPTAPSKHLPPRIILSEMEEREAARYGLVNQQVIAIPGATSKLANRIVIGASPVDLPRADFVLFMRLVLALFETEDGYLDWQSIRYGRQGENELTYAPEGLEQALSRLRKLVRGALGEMDAGAFIQRSENRVRISSHKRLVVYDRGALLAHKEKRVRMLAERLPSLASSLN